MSGRIARRFTELAEAGHGGLVAFLPQASPTPETSAELVAGPAAAGADLVELGMPFSDPMGDGPTIQASVAVTRPGRGHDPSARTLAIVRRLRGPPA